MSTKNIARTVIEPGRTNSYKYDTHQHTRRERHKVSTKLHLMRYDQELADEEVFEPRNIEWGVDQKDKLSPLWRWLYSHIGQKWDDVYSKMKLTFDFRTTPGRHVVDHLLQYVDLPNRFGDYNVMYRYIGFEPEELYVDLDGVLRYKPKKPKRRNSKPISKKVVIKWFMNRKVKIEGDELWLFGSKKIEYKWQTCYHFDSLYYRHNCPYERKAMKMVRRRYDNTTYEEMAFACLSPIVPDRLVRLRKLTKNEKKFWFSLSDEIRTRYTFHAYDV